MDGQLVAQEARGSQVSFPSFTPLPHLIAQSSSFVLLQPGGQQSSLDMQAVCSRSFTHWALQVPPLISLRSWHSWAGQAVGQDARGSQVSPLSLTPLSQATRQSESLVAKHPGGQQPSPGMQAVCCRSFTHSAVQVLAFTSLRSWQPSAAQVVGQETRGSQVSLPSLAPLPHMIMQSASVSTVQPAGQQPSPSLHMDSRPDSTQRAVHWSAAPSSVNMVQPRFGQLAGQELGGSHSSPFSITSFPHWA